MTNNEDMGRWYTDFLVKNQRVPTFCEAYMHSKPEIDALNEYIRFQNVKLSSNEDQLQHYRTENAALQDSNKRLAFYNKELQAEVERLRAYPMHAQTPPARRAAIAKVASKFGDEVPDE